MILKPVFMNITNRGFSSRQGGMLIRPHPPCTSLAVYIQSVLFHLGDGVPLISFLSISSNVQKSPESCADDKDPDLDPGAALDRDPAWSLIKIRFLIRMQQWIGIPAWSLIKIRMRPLKIRLMILIDILIRILNFEKSPV